MEVVGLFNLEDPIQLEFNLIQFTLTLFEELSFQLYDINKYTIDSSTASVLVICFRNSIDVDQVLYDIKTFNKPVILLLLSDDKNLDRFDQLAFDINSSVFLFKIKAEECKFEKELGLMNIQKRIELKQIVNRIQYTLLNLKDSSRNSCGIERRDLEYGDESDY